MKLQLPGDAACAKMPRPEVQRARQRFRADAALSQLELPLSAGSRPRLPLPARPREAPAPGLHILPKRAEEPNTTVNLAVIFEGKQEPRSVRETLRHLGQSLAPKR